MKMLAGFHSILSDFRTSGTLGESSKRTPLAPQVAHALARQEQEVFLKTREGEGLHSIWNGQMVVREASGELDGGEKIACTPNSASLTLFHKDRIDALNVQVEGTTVRTMAAHMDLTNPSQSWQESHVQEWNLAR